MHIDPTNYRVYISTQTQQRKVFMNADVLKTPTSRARKSIPIEERAAISCHLLWEQIPAPKEPTDFPLILRLTRHGLRLAHIAQSNYYREVFATMRDSVERRSRS